MRHKANGDHLISAVLVHEHYCQKWRYLVVLAKHRLSIDPCQEPAWLKTSNTN